jgi:hypothetical protein
MPITLNGDTGIVSPAIDVTTPITVSDGGTGLSTLTANNVILGNGTSTPSFVAPSTSGNILTSNGTTWTSAAAPASGFGNMEVFTSTGTFTVPAGITKVKVTVVGGGGNGGTQSGAGRSSSGGGGGGAIKVVSGLTPGGTVSVTVGGAAGTSSFGAFCSATGGASGASGSTSFTNGGVGSGGDVNFTGMKGCLGNSSTGLTGNYGGGDSAFSLGFGAQPTQSSNTVGIAGNLYGGGGGGAFRTSAGSTGGGTGAAGIVIVEY